MDVDTGASFTGILFVIKAVGLTFTAIIITLLNSLIIFLFVRFRRLRTYTNFLLASLAGSLIMFGVVTIPTHLISEFDLFYDDEFLCVVISAPTTMFSLLMLFNIVALCIERAIYILMPIKHSVVVTRLRTLVVVLVLWIYSIGFGALPLLGWNALDARREFNMTLVNCSYAIIMSGSYLACLFIGHIVPGAMIMLVISMKIFYVARLQQRRIREVTGTHSHEQTDRNKRVSLIILTFGNMYVITNIPLLSAFLIDFDYFTRPLLLEWKAPYSLYVFGILLSAVSAVIQPLVLAFGKRDIRLALVGVLRTTKRDRRTSSNIRAEN